MKNRVLFSSEKGAALAMTLLVISLLACLTIGFSEETSTETDLTAYWRDEQKAANLSASGIQMVLAALARYLKTGENSLGEDWSRISLPIPEVYQEEGTFLRCRVEDENGKFSLNSIITPEGAMDERRENQLRRLLKALDLNESLADALLDWLDPDSDQRPDGAEESYYRGLEEPYGCGNGPFQTVGQVRLVKGMKEIPAGGAGQEGGFTEHYLTVHSDGLINVNAAPLAVLQSLSERMDKSLAEAVIDYRRARKFEGISELKTVPGIDEALFKEIKEYVTVKGSAYRIEAVARYRGAESRVSAIVIRQKEQLTIAYWMAT